MKRNRPLFPPIFIAITGMGFAASVVAAGLILMVFLFGLNLTMMRQYNFFDRPFERITLNAGEVVSQEFFPPEGTQILRIFVHRPGSARGTVKVVLKNGSNGDILTEDDIRIEALQSDKNYFIDIPARPGAVKNHDPVVLQLENVNTGDNSTVVLTKTKNHNITSTTLIYKGAQIPDSSLRFHVLGRTPLRQLFFEIRNDLVQKLSTQKWFFGAYALLLIALIAALFMSWFARCGKPAES